MGAASELLATLLFVVAFVVIATSPGSDPEFPNVNTAQFTPAYLTEHLNQIRAVTLLTVLGIALPLVPGEPVDAAEGI